MEARNPRSGFWQGLCLLRAVKEDLFLASLPISGRLLAVFRIAWLTDTSPHSLSSSSHDILLCTYLSQFALFKGY